MTNSERRREGCAAIAAAEAVLMESGLAALMAGLGEDPSAYGAPLTFQIHEGYEGLQVDIAYSEGHIYLNCTTLKELWGTPHE